MRIPSDSGHPFRVFLSAGDFERNGESTVFLRILASFGTKICPNSMNWRYLSFLTSIGSKAYLLCAMESLYKALSSRFSCGVQRFPRAFLRFFPSAVLLICISAGCRSPEANHMKTMAEEYAKLREQKRTKAQGVFVNDLDGADGRLSKRMFELGERLGALGHTQEDVIRIMGAPDAIIRGNTEHDEYKDSHDPQAIVVPENSTRLVYFSPGGPLTCISFVSTKKFCGPAGIWPC